MVEEGAGVEAGDLCHPSEVVVAEEAEEEQYQKSEGAEVVVEGEEPQM